MALRRAGCKSERHAIRHAPGLFAAVTDHYAVIGTPIKHSQSPALHAAFAAQTGQDLRYDALEAPADGFAAAAQAFRAAGGRGMNVTTPFKLDAFAFATEPQPRAQAAGAVNALAFEGERVLGENFDGVGLVRDIAVNRGVALAGCRVLVLGAGGAARGILPALLEGGPALVAVANRTLARAEALAGAMAARGPVAALHPDALAAAAPFHVVLNATSSSLRGELVPLPGRCFAPGCLAYELSYGRGLTPFLAMAQSAGAPRLADGWGMLVEQAAESFAWWRGIRPETADLLTRAPKLAIA